MLDGLEEGKIKFYNADKAFGFITKSDGDDIFFHISGWQSEEQPEENARVTFKVGEGQKGPAAENVSLVQ